MQSKGNGDSEVYRELDENDDSLTDSDIEVDYANAARTFMQTLLDNALSLP
jgi:hypothetical protein